MKTALRTGHSYDVNRTKPCTILIHDIPPSLVAAGEVFTLPLVVLVSLLAQPRVYYMMSLDGLLPKVFREIDYSGGGRREI